MTLRSPLFSRTTRAACIAILFALMAVPFQFPAAPAQGQATEESTEEPKAKIVLAGGSLSIVLAQLEKQTGAKVTALGEVSAANVTITMEGTAEEVLNYLAEANGWVWVQEDNGSYSLMNEEIYKTRVLKNLVIEKKFTPQHRTAEEIQQAFESMRTPDISSIAVDPVTGIIIVHDLPERIAAMQKLLDEIDKPLNMRIFTIHYASIEDIVPTLSSMLSDVGEIMEDPRTQKILVLDRLPNIKKMELLVGELDSAPMVRVYDINNIGIEQEAFGEIIELIQSETTEEDNVKVSYEQSRIIVEDVPQVHDRISRLLRAFDTPVKQVWVQAEIIEVDLYRSYSFSAEFEFSPNVEKAINQGLLSLFSPTAGSDDSGQQDGGSTGVGFMDLEDATPTLKIGSGGIEFNTIGESFAMMLSSLLSDSDTKVLLKPRLMVRNGKEAEIDVGRKEPIPTVFFDNNVNNNFRTSTQTTVDTGLKVWIQPWIGSNGLIELDLEVENSEPFRVPVRTGDGTQDLVGETKQSTRTTMIIPSGETRVIGGLVRNQNSETRSGVPVLRSVPIIGNLFGSKSKTKQARTLWFFITPSIVEERAPIEFIENSQVSYRDIATPMFGVYPVGEDGEALGWQEPATGQGAGGESVSMIWREPGMWSSPDETGPLASEPMTIEDSFHPLVTLSSEPPPPTLSGGPLERAFGDREIPDVRSSYSPSASGASFSITPAERSAIIHGAPTASATPKPKPAATPSPTPAPTPSPTPAPDQDK